MRKITKYLAATAVLSFALTINANAAVKSVTITAPTKSASYTAYVAGKSISKNLKVAVKTTGKKDSKAVTYKSSNSKVVSITNKGKMTFKKAGKATITVASKKSPKIKDTLKITVKQGAKKILVTTKEGYAVGKTFTITKGKSISTKVVQTPLTAGNKVKWTTSNKKVATVSSKGVIKAVKTGTAKITAVASDGCGAKFTTKIKVVAGKVTGLKVNKTKLTLTKGKTGTVKATVSTSGKGANTKLLWTSSNTKVATVSQTGKIKAIKKGTATITVKTIDGSNKKATIKITVINPVKPTEPVTEPTTKPVEPTTEPTTKPEEPTTEPTTKPEEPTTEPTTKPEEPTTEPTTKPEEPTTEPTTKPEEPTTEPTTKPESKLTKFEVTVDTAKAAKDGITANGTNTIKWDNPEQAFKASTALTNDTTAYLKNNPLGIKFDIKLTGMSLSVDGKGYVTKYENDTWKLFTAEGKEVSVKETLKDKTIVNLNVKKDTTKTELDSNLNRLYMGHRNLKEKTYDYGTGVLTVGKDEYKITKAVVDGSAHALKLTVNGADVTVDMTENNTFVLEGKEDITSIKNAVKAIFSDAITIK